ncbi:coiled-coil domain-containing protein 93 isoform X2 [Sitodiplosis mosellana]|uniref:coiled-coil domain-containing protein 93 isoform X2 n=1 Tax=Sitodiplosis mosellana TaxID=263140 RepID=UPI002443EAB7|nr:coiled-coil domain-containing protein 93 isoform X2 [Sitodiplosis mosellana]
MGSRDCFSKVLPNVKLATRFDADGKEVQVERREDEEQNVKQQDIFDILVAAGYFRARIKGLSAFDKIVGGMTWCISACDYDVDVDLLFHENLTIGQKITLTEKIVAALPRMKCPYLIEPHQIQGLDFINIFPVIQWLVKRSVENRAEKAAKLNAFAVGQFHNHFSLKTEQEQRQKFLNATERVKEIQNIYRPHRKYKRKDAGAEDEQMRVRITLLEYGNKGKDILPQHLKADSGAKSSSNATSKGTDETSNDLDHDIIKFNEVDKKNLLKNLTELKTEMSIDTKQLSEQNTIKTLLATKTILDKKLQKVQEENRNLEANLREEEQNLNKLDSDVDAIKDEIRQLDAVEIKATDKKELVRRMLEEKEELRHKEVQFKEHCRQELARLQKELHDAEMPTSEEDLHQMQDTMEKEKERLHLIRMQLAKKNRAIVSIERKLDNIPDRTELAQYQRRFIELYSQVSAKHRETKQYFTLYNTLNDTKQYLTRELSLLNSIFENYAEGMSNMYAKEQFVLQLEQIVDGVGQTKLKIKNKLESEKSKRDEFNAQLSALVEQQRKYAVVLKQFTKDCERNEHLVKQLKALQAAAKIKEESK